jgi:P4 family phage/plasmid primase-like protien
MSGPYTIVEFCYGKRNRGKFVHDDMRPDVTGQESVFQGPYLYHEEVKRYYETGPVRIEGQKLTGGGRLKAADMTDAERNAAFLFRYDSSGTEVHLVATQEQAKAVVADGKHALVKRRNSLSRFNGKVSIPYLWVDVDETGDLAKARRRTVTIASELITMGVPSECIVVRFSGSKGFHVLFPSACVGKDIFAPGPVQQQSKILQKVMPALFPGLDEKVYLSSQLMRIPNTVHEKTRIHCIPLTLDEVQNLTMDQITALAANPRPVDYLRVADPETAPIASTLREKFQETWQHEVQRAARYSTQSTASRVGGGASVEQVVMWLDANGWPYEPPRPLDERRQIIKLLRCPREDQHGTPGGDQGAFIVDEDKSFFFTCFHSGCTPPKNPVHGRPDHAALTEDAVRRITGARGVPLEVQPMSLDGANYTALADALVEEEYTAEGLPTLRRYRDTFYQYNGRGYEEQPDQEVADRTMAWLRRKVDRKANVTTQRNMVAHLSAIGLIPFDALVNAWLDDEHPKGDYLTLKNGILNIEGHIEGKPREEVFFSHSPLYFGPPGPNYNYDPEARSPEFETMLATALPDPELRQLVQEYGGYTLTTSCAYQMFMVFVGGGSNGKNTVGDIIAAVNGPANVCSVPLANFGDRFALWPLARARLNYVSELPTTHGSGSVRLAEEKLKAMTTGDVIRVERKHKDTYDVRPTAKLLFLGNELPPLYDRTEGVWRRMLTVPFDQVIPEEKRIPDYARKIFKKEAPGILNWLLVGLKRLKERGHFIEPEACKRLKNQHRLACDHEAEYLMEHFQYDANAPETFTTTADLIMSGYRNWCEANGYRPVGKNKLGEAIGRVFPEAMKRRQLVTPRFGTAARKLTVYQKVIPYTHAKT